MMRLRLPAVGRYIYRELLDQCYIDGNFPDEPEVLARIVDVSLKEFNRHWALVSKAFELRDDGCWHHGKADAVLENIINWKEKQSLAGKASGKARRENSKHSLNGRSTSVEHPFNEAPTPVEVSSTSTSTTTRTERVVVVEVQSVGAPPLPPAAETIPDHAPIAPVQNITPGSISEPDTISGQALDQLARDLVNRLAPRHWAPVNAPAAVGQVERILAKALHPECVAASIEVNHASWAAYHKANPRAKRRALQWWLADEEYLFPVAGYTAAPAAPVIDEAPVVEVELSDEELAALDAQMRLDRLQEALRA